MEKKTGRKPSALHVRIPEDLHRRVRIHCAEMGVRIKDFVIEALEEKLEKGEQSTTRSRQVREDDG